MFCGLVIIKLERALYEFYGSLDVGLNLSVRKLQWVTEKVCFGKQSSSGIHAPSKEFMCDDVKRADVR